MFVCLPVYSMTCQNDGEKQQGSKVLTPDFQA